jgi:hypothetical protein
MPIIVLIGVACGIFFYRAATVERMSAPLWAAASGLATVAVTGAGGGTAATLAAQAGLFVVMWWYNATRRRRKPVPRSPPRGGA